MIEINTGDRELSAKFSASFDNAEEFYQKVHEFVDNNRGLQDYRFLINLGVRELVTNAITHGSQKNSAKNVNVKIKFDSSRLKIEVEDQGKGFDRAKLDQPEEKILSPGGRGYEIIKNYYDDIKFNEMGNIVKITKNLNN